jgi:hypothetical protein
MAFVRWRGNSATLLATVYDQGKTHQMLLAALGGGYHVPSGIRKMVAERFPTISVDWKAVNRAMAKGPLGEAELTERQMSYLEVENHLRDWAVSPLSNPRESQQFILTADLLSSWRSQMKV